MSEPNWHEIFRVISESIEPKPNEEEIEQIGAAELSAGGAWKAEYVCGSTPYMFVLDAKPRNWLEPAAAMELLKRMPSPRLEFAVDWGAGHLNLNKWGSRPVTQVMTLYKDFTWADTPEEAIVLATYAMIKEKR